MISMRCIKTQVMSMIKFKKSTLKYFDQFYGIINDPKKAKRQVLEVCRAKHNHVF